MSIQGSSHSRGVRLIPRFVDAICFQDTSFSDEWEAESAIRRTFGVQPGRASVGGFRHTAHAERRRSPTGRHEGDPVAYQIGLAIMGIHQDINLIGHGGHVQSVGIALPLHSWQWNGTSIDL